MTNLTSQRESEEEMRELRKEIKKLSLKKGDCIIAHFDLRNALESLKIEGMDFVVPIIFTDDLNKITKLPDLRKLIPSEEEIRKALLSKAINTRQFNANPDRFVIEGDVDHFTYVIHELMMERLR